MQEGVVDEVGHCQIREGAELNERNIGIIKSANILVGLVAYSTSY